MTDCGEIITDEDIASVRAAGLAQSARRGEWPDCAEEMRMNQRARAEFDSRVAAMEAARMEVCDANA